MLQAVKRMLKPNGQAIFTDSALARLEPPIGLANNVDAAPAADHAAVAVALFRRFQRIDDFHFKHP